MNHTTIHEKSPGTCDSKELTADTIGTNFPTTAHERKAFASLAAPFAVAGFQVFPNLKIEIRPTVDNAAVSYYLNRRPQTLPICSYFAFLPLKSSVC